MSVIDNIKIEHAGQEFWYPQHNADGYLTGEDSCHGSGLMPNNCEKIWPQLESGYIPRWMGGQWEQVENHKGKSGYLNGEQRTIKDYGPLPDGWSDTPPPPTAEEKAALARAQRDSLLAETDYLLMPDYPSSGESRAVLIIYRQALRDITEQAGFPDGVEWPEKPQV